MKKTIFIADFRYGRGNLAKAILVRETTKTYWVENPQNLLEWIYVPKRFKKDKYHISYSWEDAMIWLIKNAQAYVERCEENLAKAKGRHEELCRIRRGLHDEMQMRNQD